MRLNQLYKAGLITILFFSEASLAEDTTDLTGSWCPNLTININSTLKKYIINKSNDFLLEAPNPLPNLKTEGLLPGQGIMELSIKARRDFEKVEYLAFAWEITKNQLYLKKAKEFIFKWAETYTPSFNPIDETKFSRLFEGYGIIRDNLRGDETIPIDRWISSFSIGYLEQLKINQKKYNPQHSNWQSHRIKIAFTAAIAVRDFKSAEKITTFLNEQIIKNIREDGSTEDYHTRDSIKYTIYSLKPLLETSLLANNFRVKKHLHHKESKTSHLLKGVDWLLPYVNGKKTHIEFKNTSVNFDKIRVNNNIEGFSISPWKPSEAKEILWLSSYLDKKYLPTAKAISSNPSATTIACQGDPFK